MSPSPRLSVIICIYDMPREAPRTILSATIPYQKGIEASDYEVIVVDNGSKQPLPESFKAKAPAGVRFVAMPDPKPSPVFAMNWAGRNLAEGRILLFAIDGARIFTDRLYAATLAAHDSVPDAFVYTLGWHLGPDVQGVSARNGYDQAHEDRMLDESGWPQRPDALYGISTFAGACRSGFFRRISESNAFSVPRDLLERMGGYDERFTSAGGGLANSEFFHRYVTRPDARNVCLLSEGTFHQFHGGIATSGAVPWEIFDDEHRAIFGRGYRAPSYRTFYYGAVRQEAIRFFRQSLDALS